VLGGVQQRTQGKNELVNAAANTDPNAPADSPASKRTRRNPAPEPERRTPPARRPKAGQPDPEEGRVQRRNAPDPAIDLPVSDVVNKLIGASGRTRKDVALAAGISEFTANDLVWGRRAWTLRNFIVVGKELNYRPGEVLVLAGLDRPAMSWQDAIRSSTTLSAVSKQSAIAFITALEDADQRR
jgi:hypothetical protein